MASQLQGMDLLVAALQTLAGTGVPGPGNFTTLTLTGALTGAAATFTGQVILGGASGAEGLRITTTVNAVNRVQIRGGTTGGSVAIQSIGSDTNVPLLINTQGAGNLFLQQGGTTYGGFINTKWFFGGNQTNASIEIDPTASASNWHVVAGSNGGAPTWSTNAGDLKIAPFTGIVQWGQTKTAAGTPASFSATNYISFKDGAGTTIYVPCATATW